MSVRSTRGKDATLVQRRRRTGVCAKSNDVLGKASLFPAEDHRRDLLQILKVQGSRRQLRTGGFVNFSILCTLAIFGYMINRMTRSQTAFFTTLSADLDQLVNKTTTHISMRLKGVCKPRTLSLRFLLRRVDQD